MNENLNAIIFTSLLALLANIVAILIEHFIVVPLRENRKYRYNLGSRNEKINFFTTERLGGGFKSIGRSSFYWVFFLVTLLVFVSFTQYYSTLVFWLSKTGINLSYPFYSFIDQRDSTFYLSFIGYISVLLGFFLPIILLRVWEQFDDLDREFDREADAVNILYEDILLLGYSHMDLRDRVILLLFDYVQHVITHYSHEHENSILLNNGNRILSKIRGELKNISYSKKKKESEAILNEIIFQLNQLIEIRGNRISFSRKRLFSSLKSIVIIISVIWIMPFYVLSYAGVFAYLLVFSLTFLIIFILTIIDDLDDPFHGTWNILVYPWKHLLSNMNIESHPSQKEIEAIKE